MKLDVSDAIRFPGTEYGFSVMQTIAPQDILGETVVYDDVKVEGTFAGTEDGNVAVDARFTTVAHARCARCLAPANAELDTGCQETFIRNGDPEDDEIFSFEGYRVDLEKLTMSYIVMATPMRFLCKEDCPGLAGLAQDDPDVSLCPEEQAGEIPTQRPFAALQQLLDAQSGESAE